MLVLPIGWGRWASSIVLGCGIGQREGMVDDVLLVMSWHCHSMSLFGHHVHCVATQIGYGPRDPRCLCGGWADGIGDTEGPLWPRKIFVPLLRMATVDASRS